MKGERGKNERGEKRGRKKRKKKEERGKTLDRPGFLVTISDRIICGNKRTKEYLLPKTSIVHEHLHNAKLFKF